jgi:hypothetical protein
VNHERVESLLAKIRAELSDGELAHRQLYLAFASGSGLVATSRRERIQNLARHKRATSQPHAEALLPRQQAETRGVLSGAV